MTADAYAADDTVLRAEVARHLARSRSVSASAADVVLTAGAQQAIDLVTRVLVEPGETVAIEDPGYPAAARSFAAHGARVVGVPVDEAGLVVEALPSSARLVYVTPSHQFPTGATMTLARRTALLDWAARRGAVIVEDDYDSEFRYCDRPLEPLQSLDTEGRVVYVGSFSKVLLPGLRSGFLIAAGSVGETLRVARRLADWSADALTQGALTRFLLEGQLAVQIRRALKVYRARRDALLQGLTAMDSVRVLPSVAGLHLTVELADQSRSDLAVVRQAARADVAVEPLSPRYLDQPARQGLLLGFRHITAERVPDALARLAKALS